jgi:hypothetical protein
MRRIPAVAAIVIGLAMIVGLVAMSGFSKASDGENLITDAEASVSNTGVVRLRKDVTTLDQASAAVVERVFPAFAREVGLDDAEFEQRLRSTHPEAAAAFLDQREAIFTSIDKTVSNLEAHQDDYDAADAIPTSWIPLTVMPFFALAFGLLLIGLGVWAWLRPGRGSSAGVALAGAVLIAFTLGTQLPSKSGQAERLLDSLNIDEAIATRTRTEFETFRAGTEDLREVFVEFARARGQTPEELGETIRRELPIVAEVAEDTAALDRIEGEVAFREEHIDEFASVDDVPLELAAWGYVVLGGVLVVAGAVGLLLSEGRRDQPETAGPV